MRGKPAVQVRAGRNRVGLAGSFLLLDVLLDDRQWCAAAGCGEVRRGPQVAGHEVLAEVAGEPFAHVVRRYAVEPVDQRGDRAPTSRPWPGCRLLGELLTVKTHRLPRGRRPRRRSGPGGHARSG